MAAALLLSSCTANNAGMSGIEKASNNSNSQIENSSVTPAPSNDVNPQSPQEIDSNQIAADQSHAEPAQVPLPTQPPSQDDKVGKSSQQTPLTDNKTADNHLVSTGNSGVPIVSPATETTSAEEAKPKKTALFSFLGKKTEPATAKNTPTTTNSDASEQSSQSNASSPNQNTSTAAPEAQHNDGGTPPSSQTTVSRDSSTEDVSQNPSNTQQPPERDAKSQKQGSLMRLFGRSDNQKSNKPVDSETKTALVPLPKKDPHEYNDDLPGVRPNGGIVIKHRTSLYDDTDIDANEIDSPSLYTLASVSIYGRSLPNGLKVARKDVEVSCLRPQLVAILKTIERRFNKPVIITSGYRSPSYNQKVNGAKRSMHMSCAAADIQVPDTNKWDVAKFVRALPNRGGVGTYCHQSIHVDVGPKRDWNWTCSAKN